MTKEQILTVDIGGSKVEIQTIDKNGERGPNVFRSLIGLKLDNDSFFRLLTDNIKPLIQVEKNSEILGISIGSPGPLDSVNGIIEDTPNLKGVKNFKIVEKLRDAFNLPVFLLNDADAAGLGEYWLGAGRGCASVVYLTLSTGVGSASLVNGVLQRGLGKAPEWGHTLLAVEAEEYQRLCNCGSFGCAEAYLGTNGLANTYAKVFNVNFANMTYNNRHSISPKLRDGVGAGEPKWLEVQKKYAHHLAILLRNIILVHQPGVIILGGGIACKNKHLLTETKKALDQIMNPAKYKIAVMKNGVNICLAEFENPVNLGAAKYAFDQLQLKGE